MLSVKYSCTNLSLQGKTWAEFSTLDASIFVYAMQLHALPKQASLKLKTQPKRLLGYLQLAYAFTGVSLY
jgi:hypothetical protein